jgi:hypothetical protein
MILKPTRKSGIVLRFLSVAAVFCMSWLFPLETSRFKFVVSLVRLEEWVKFLAPNSQGQWLARQWMALNLPVLVNVNVTMERSTMLLMGKSTISTGPCSIANCKRLPEGIPFRNVNFIQFYHQTWQRMLTMCLQNASIYTFTIWMVMVLFLSPQQSIKWYNMFFHFYV